MAKFSVPPRFGVWASAAPVARASAAASATRAIVLRFIRSLRFLSPPLGLDFYARRKMSRFDLPQRRHRLPAFGAGERTARIEHASGRRRQWARQLTLDEAGRARLLDGRIGHRGGVEQNLRIGVQRVAI